MVFTARALLDLEAVPPRVTSAVAEFAFGDLAAHPRRVGKPLQRELLGLWAARRGSYRFIYRVDDDASTVVVQRVAHRGHAYRS